jgi:hypothetical protein
MSVEMNTAEVAYMAAQERWAAIGAEIEAAARGGKAVPIELHDRWSEARRAKEQAEEAWKASLSR